MVRRSAGEEFAFALWELKERKRCSYVWLGRMTHLSSSSVHRYCTGKSLPGSFGVGESIARACGATKSELAALYTLWARADAEAERERSGGEWCDGTAVDEMAPVVQPSPVRTAVEPTLVPAAETPSVGRRRLRVALRVVACVLAIGLTVSASSVRTAQPTPARPFGWASMWRQTPTEVPAEFFGVTSNSSTGATPTFRVGGVRLWDSRTRWANLQPRRGVYDWSVLDRVVAGAERAGLPVTFTFGGTPGWAAPAGPRTAYDDGSRTAPPDDLGDWDALVGAVVERYRTRIQAYEIWVNANHPKYYSGDVETLVAMTSRAGRIIKGRDPGATVVCPSMDRLWTPEGAQVLRNFVDLGGFEHCDAAGVKLYLPQAAEPPERMLDETTVIDQAFHRAGVHPPIWNTGTAYEVPLARPLDEDTAVDYAVRFFLVGLYARYQRMFFYNWGGTKIPIVLQADGGSPTRAALAVEELQRWLHEVRIESCGQGTPAQLPDNVWQCVFGASGSGGDGGAGDGERSAAGRQLKVLWTHAGTAHIRVGREGAELHRLDGSTVTLAPGADVTVTTRPLLLITGPDPGSSHAAPRALGSSRPGAAAPRRRRREVGTVVNSVIAGAGR